MKKKNLVRMFLISVLGLFFAFPVLVDAQNYGMNNDSTRIDSSRGAGQYKNMPDTTKSDAMGYNKPDNMNHMTSDNMNIKMDPAGSSAYSNNGNSKAVTINPAKELSQKLEKDVNLNDNQTSKVKSILLQYESDTYEAQGDQEDVNDAAKDAKEDIADVLTESQKSQWQNVKGQWWNSVNKELNLSNLKNNNS